MQTQSIFRVSLYVILLALLASCHKSNTQGRLVPNDAAVVVVADGKSLSSKLSWDEIKQNPELQNVLLDNSTPAYIRSILNKPDSSGVDVQSDLILFVEKDSIGGYVVVEGTVKDPALFKNFIHQIDSAGAETQIDDMSFISQYPSCVGWNKDKFVYILDAPSIGNMDSHSQRMINDSIDITRNRDIGATCKSIFALDEKNSLAKNEKFTKLVKEPGDIHFWINSGVIYSQLPMFSAGPMAMLNLDDFYKDNVTTATLSFDNGKISLNSRSYMSDKMLAFYKQYVDGKINEDMIQHMPGKDIDGIAAVNFKPEGIKELLKQLNIDGMANGGLKQLNLTIDDITSAFKGDFLFGASDFNIKVDSEEMSLGDGSSFKSPKETSEGNFVFAASIADKDAFNKILNTAKKLIAQSQGDDTTTNLPFSYDNNNDYFVLTNTKDNTAKFLAGANPDKFDFISDINGQPFGAYINIQLLLKGLSGVVDKDSSSQALYDASLKMWNNITMKGGNLDGDVSTSNVEINLVDNSTNSLKQLSQYISKISGIIKEKNAKIEAAEANDMRIDTTRITAPPSENSTPN